MSRFYAVLAALVILGSAYGAYRSLWLAPGEVVRNVPKNVRQNPGSYRAHYRTVYVHHGGK